MPGAGEKTKERKRAASRPLVLAKLGTDVLALDKGSHPIPTLPKQAIPRRTSLSLPKVSLTKGKDRRKPQHSAENVRHPRLASY